MSDSITIPGGGGSTLTLNIPGMFTQTIVDAFASALESAASTGTLVTASVTASGVPTLPAGSTGFLIIGADAPAQITVPAGYAYLADTAAAAVTVNGSDQAISLMAEFGNLTYFAGSGGGTVVAAGGNNVFYGPAADGTSYTLSYGGGANTVWAGASNVVVSSGNGANFVGLGSGGGLVVSGGSDTVALDVGAATVMNQAADAITFGSPTNALVVNQASANTIVAGAGSDSIFGAQVASVGGSTYFLASSITSASTMVENIVSDTIVAGIGNAYVWGGAGDDEIYSYGGNLAFIAGSGSTTINGGAGSDITLFGTTDGNWLFAGAGNETINAWGASGANTFVGGTGNTQFIVDPAAAASFFFLSGSDGGSDSISGLSASDSIKLGGTSLLSSTLLSSGTRLTLTDGTTIWLQGYTGPVNINPSSG